MSDEARKITPMMERYLEVKRQNPGALLLFRMGDFYELFYEDAEIAARTLGLTLTSRDKGSTNPIPMAGFPYHALDGYLQKLVRAGIRAAICEQVEDPKQAKGLVKREVTQVVTPGTLIEDALLDPRESNFLACVFPDRSRVGLAWLELSSGRFVATDIAPEELADELARLRPAECLVPEGTGLGLGLEDGGWRIADGRKANIEHRTSNIEHQSGRPSEAQSTKHKAPPSLNPQPSTLNLVITERPPWSFARDECRRRLLDHFQTATLDGFDLDEDSPGVVAAGALLEYVQETQRSALGHVTRLEPYRRGTHLVIDETTRGSLELTRTIREGRRDGTLLWVMDETVTAMGARLLSEWLSNPLIDPAEINRRLDAVEELTTDAVLCRELREQLERGYDLSRLTARAATGRASPKDLGCLASTLALLPKLKAKLAGRRAELLGELESALDLCPDVRADIEQSLVDEPPLSTTDGGIIRPGFHARLDELRDLARGGKEWIAAYQAQEVQRTGIPNLKIGFNKVFGYYLEVTAAQASKVPADYIRKQTLKNQERYVTPELKEHEDKVLRAEEGATSLEQELFQALRGRVAAHAPRLMQSAAVLAQIDVLAALAVLAVKLNYVRPEIVDDPVLDIRDGRHPVLDRLQPSGEFVPNDIVLGVEGGGSRVEGREPEADRANIEHSTSNIERRTQESPAKRKAQSTKHATDHEQRTTDNAPPSTLDAQPSTIALITGPNMAGKSTYIRQAALVTIMAQMGSFVPARAARIGVADRVFARVGASDELSKGQSTFMVEMTETARILNTATRRSLVILDEIGRGTSTYDGISLAWAVTEYLHDVAGCRTLFATHYHELTELTQTLKCAANWNVAVHEQGDQIVFLHKIVPGAADKSYGIHVARLAGVPASVVERARVVLETLEADHLDDRGRPKVPERPTRRTKQRQLALFSGEHHPLLDEIRDLNLDQMTPLAALQELQRLREKLSSGS